MTTDRAKVIRLLSFVLLVLAATSSSWAQQRDPIIEKIAKVYGLDSWDKIEAVRYARDKKVPYFGICLGLQCGVIEFARNVMGLADANSTEIDQKCEHPVVCLLDEQYDITDLGGTMRLGSYPCVLIEGSKAHQAYGSTLIHERHRHRYELNNQYISQLKANGFLISGTSPDEKLVEIIELRDHPWFVAVQCHPEFKSKPTRAHPLFQGLVQASLARRGEKKGEAGRVRSASQKKRSIGGCRPIKTGAACKDRSTRSWCGCRSSM